MTKEEYDNKCIALLENFEFSVIPVGKDKKPLIEWKRYQTELPAVEEARTWAKQFPQCLWALVTGELSGIACVDADNSLGAEWIEENLDFTWVRDNSFHGKHYFYKHCPGGRNKTRICGDGPEDPWVDTREEGGYVILYDPYIIEGCGSWSDLPMLKLPGTGMTSTKGSVPSGEGIGNLSSLSLTGIRPKTENVPVEKGRRNSTLASLVGKWISKGMDDIEILDMALGWNSRLQEPLPVSEVKHTIESVIKTDERNSPGFRQAILVGGAEEDDDAPMPVQTEAVELDATLLTDHGGLVDAFMEAARDHNAVSDPIYDFAGAMALASMLAGLRYVTKTGLHLNTYTICIGRSGTGKDAPMKTLSKVLNGEYSKQLAGITKVTSESAIYRTLEEYPHKKLLRLDECGFLFAAMKNSMSSEATIQKAILELYSSAGYPAHQRFADKKLKIDIPYTYLSIIGMTTPDKMWNSLTGADIDTGLLGRCIFFENHELSKCPSDPVSLKFPKSLIAKVDDIAKRCIPYPEDDPDYAPIPFDDAANAVHEAWKHEIHAKRNAFESAGRNQESAMYARYMENLDKYATTLALTHCWFEGEPMVTMTELNTARMIMDQSVAVLQRAVEENMASTDFERVCKRVVSRLKADARAGRQGTTRARLEAHCHDVEPKVIDIAIKKLLSTGEIAEKAWKPEKGRAVGKELVGYVPAK